MANTAFSLGKMKSLLVAALTCYVGRTSKRRVEYVDNHQNYRLGSTLHPPPPFCVSMLFPLRQTDFSSFWKLFVFPLFHFSLVFLHFLTFLSICQHLAILGQTWSWPNLVWPNLVLAQLGLAKLGLGQTWSGQTWSWPNLVWPNLATKLGQTWIWPNLVSPRASGVPDLSLANVDVDSGMSVQLFLQDVVNRPHRVWCGCDVHIIQKREQPLPIDQLPGRPPTRCVDPMRRGGA